MDRIHIRTDKSEQPYENTIRWNPKRALFPLFPLVRYYGVYPCDCNWNFTDGWMKYCVCVLLIPILSDIYQLIYGITMPDEVMSVATFNIVLHEVRASLELLSVSGHLYKLITDKETLIRITDHIKSRKPRSNDVFSSARFQTSAVVFNMCLGTFLLNWKTVWTKSLERRVLITGLSITNTYVVLLTVLYCSIMEIFTNDFRRVTSSIAKGADLKVAIQQHQLLNDYCNMTAQFFCVHLIAHCVNISSTTVQDIHLCIQNVLAPRSAATTSFAVLAAMHASYQLAYMYLITAYSEDVYNESLGFYGALMKKVLRQQKYYVDREITTYLSMRRTVKITAAGFFELNRPVFTSVVGGCVTYVVIVIQLSSTGE